MYQRVGKRFLDVLLALAGLLVSLPLLVVLTGLMAVVNRGSPFFVQPRSGRFGRVFQLIKFKTMTDRRGADGQLLPDAARLTRAGNWLRRTSLDELPQLLNILRGDMSLVGPRPLLVAYWPLYSTDQRRRHLVRPGLTGWAQVNGRNALSWEEKFALDTWYVANGSLMLDLTILWRTAVHVLGWKSTCSETALMPRFTGSPAS
ncbi:MAG: sugar transferase [Bacteroidetes bacterium]|nr:sugar transferase [Fibrella sp.]